MEECQENTKVELSIADLNHAVQAQKDALLKAKNAVKIKKFQKEKDSISSKSFTEASKMNSAPKGGRNLPKLSKLP